MRRALTWLNLYGCEQGCLALAQKSLKNQKSISCLLLSLCQTASQPNRLSNINALQVNQFYTSKDQNPTDFLEKTFFFVIGLFNEKHQRGSYEVAFISALLKSPQQMPLAFDNFQNCCPMKLQFQKFLVFFQPIQLIALTKYYSNTQNTA